MDFASTSQVGSAETAHLHGICIGSQISTTFSGLGGRAGNAAPTAPQLPVSAHPLPLSLTPVSPSPRLPNPAAMAATGRNKHGGAGSWSSCPGCRPRTFEGGRQGQLPSHGWKEEGLSGATRLLGQRPLPARAIVGPVPCVNLKVG